MNYVDSLKSSLDLDPSAQGYEMEASLLSHGSKAVSKTGRIFLLFYQDHYTACYYKANKIAYRNDLLFSLSLLQIQKQINYFI